MTTVDTDSRRRLGNRIRLIRLMKRMSRAEVADQLGMHETQISKLEAGRMRFPEPAQIKKIADALGVLPTQLLGPGGEVVEVEL